MSKLIDELPETCEKCPFLWWRYNSEACCALLSNTYKETYFYVGKCVDHEQEIYCRHPECPLEAL